MRQFKQELKSQLQAITTLKPLSDGVDGLRGSLIGVTHFGLSWDVSVLAAVAAVFLGLGAWSYSKIEL